MIDRAAMTRSRVIVLALIAAAVMYKTLNLIGQGGTSLMFVGLPAVLAVVVAFAPPSKSATGTIMKVLTLTLLLGGILLIEASVCLLMAAPLLYAIGVGVGAAVDVSRRRGQQVRVSLLVPLIVLSLQGTIPGTSGPRGIEASAERIVDVAADDIAAKLRCPERFDRTLPAFFRIGRFPRPLSCRYEKGRFVIDFEQGEPMHHKLAHSEHPGRPQLVLKITESGPRRIRFGLVSDNTMLSHWARFRSSTLEWDALDADTTRVRWTIRVERKLDPVWYFAPMQHYAAGRAAAYLIDTVVR
jgi:hypothetical protein